MTTTTVPEVGDRVRITMGRWAHLCGRLVALTATDATVELADRLVTVAPSMIVRARR